MNLSLFEEPYRTKPTSPKEFQIALMDKNNAKEIFRKFHYFGEKDFLCSYSYGAIYNGEVWGAISYGIPNARNIKGLYTEDTQQGVLEITRLAFNDDSPRNSCSWFIAKTIKDLQTRYPLRLIITYADTAQNHVGTIYKAANFTYHGLTAKKTDFIQDDGKVKKLKGVKYSDLQGEWVSRSRKHLFSYKVGK